MKIVYLILSTNNQFTMGMEQVIRETWLTCTNAPHYFVVESNTGSTYIEGDRMYVECPPGINFTFYKMCGAMRKVLELHPDVDVIVRPNTSTWVNTGALESFIHEHAERGNIYSGNILTIPTSRGYLPYIQGQLMIFFREEAEAIARCTPSNTIGAIDDYWLSIVACQHIIKEHGEYIDRMHSLGMLYAKDAENTDVVTSDVFSTFLFIQIKNFRINGEYVTDSQPDYRLRETEPQKMREVHQKFLRCGEVSKIHVRYDEDVYIETKKRVKFFSFNPAIAMTPAYHTREEFRISMYDFLFNINFLRADNLLRLNYVQ